MNEISGVPMTSVLKALQQSLPKPLLFGLYGAFGSFTGALLLGELLWVLLVPPPPKPPEPPAAELRIAASGAISVNQGDMNQFTVKVARDNFAGDVSVKCAGLPRGVSAKDVVIPRDSDEMELQITAATDADVGTHEVKVQAASSGVSAVALIAVTIVKVDPPPPPAQVDIVFVLDTTGSMGFALDGIIHGIGDFAKELESKELDVRLGMLAFQDLLFNEPSLLLKFEKGSPFTADFEAFREELKKVHIGDGVDEPESSLDALAEAARLPFREGATRVLVLVTDASPHIPDKTIRSIEDCRKVLTDMQISQLHLVLRRNHRRIYEPLQNENAGEYFNIVEAAGGSAGFAKILPSVSSAIAKITIQNRPAKPKTMPSKKAAPPPPLPGIKGVQSSAEFSADSKWQLIAAIAVWTSVAAVGISLTLLAGQYFYLRQSLLPFTAAIKGMVLGCVAGLAGGAAGQLLYGYFPQSALLDGAFRVFGWSLLGATVASGISLSIPNLRWDKALIGGALGGIAGALGFLGATMLLPSNSIGDIGGRLVGATLVGFFIGLMVAWAEAAFRHAWLEIRYGAKEIRRVNLGTEPVSLGGDSRACTIFVAGGAPVALRYRISDAKVFRETVTTGRDEEVRDGSHQILGSVEVNVRTSASAVKPLAAPTVPLPPPPKGSTTTASPKGAPQSGSTNAPTAGPMATPSKPPVSPQLPPPRPAGPASPAPPKPPNKSVLPPPPKKPS